MVTGFGEGATDEGIFWEAVNFASLHSLPVVFVCENNKYATFSPQSKRQRCDNLSERVGTFGMRTAALFGNDVVRVYLTVRDAIESARAGGGPTFIEAYTYRWNGHVGPESDDVQNYRPVDEVKFWKDRCPIALLERSMVVASQLSTAGKEALSAEIQAEIDDAFAFAKHSPFPSPPDWRASNYDDASPMADRFLAEPELCGFDQNQKLAIPGPY